MLSEPTQFPRGALLEPAGKGVKLAGEPDARAGKGTGRRVGAVGTSMPLTGPGATFSGLGRESGGMRPYFQQ